jgi:hypothetical protein
VAGPAAAAMSRRPWLTRYDLTDAGAEAVRLRAEKALLVDNNERLRQALGTRRAGVWHGRRREGRPEPGAGH